MRGVIVTGRVQTVLLAVVLLSTLPSPALADTNPGAVFLMIWPDPRSTALGGAMTGLADDAAAAYWNPGGLGFQNGTGAVVSATPCGWLPNLHPGMYLVYLGGGKGIATSLGEVRNLNVGLDLMYLNSGNTEVIKDRPIVPRPTQGDTMRHDTLGYYTTWDLALGAHGAVRIGDLCGIGLSVKYLRSYLAPPWIWDSFPEFGIDSSGPGVSCAVDVGVLLKPWNWLSAGLVLANIGPDIRYVYPGSADPLPMMYRLGICLTPLDNSLFRLRLMPEVDQVLVGSTIPWRGFGTELTVKQLVSLRLGYFEDIDGQRGGVVVYKRGVKQHISLSDFLFKTGAAGDFRSVGICYGFGIGYKDYVRLDVSNDALIYDFKTSNWKASLTANDIGALARLLRRRP